MSKVERTLVEAGAGCGKTTSIIEKFKSALSSKKEGGKAYLPESCVLLTFTDAAAREMRARIKKKYPELPLSSSFVGTFHSYCLHLLSNARLVGDAKILSDSELTLLIKEEFIRCVSEEPELTTLLSYLSESRKAALQTSQV
jgi:DNA helicase-2/ATP-dependent DNA helicase PcrA